MRWGLGRSLAMIALIVQAPRLILSILDADQIPISPSTRQTLLIIAAIGTASILTGGQLYLIHVIGTVRKWRPGLVIIWLGVLTFSGAMIIPAVFGGLSSTLLPSVLSLEQKLWWSLIAAMSHELTAAGCVLASIAHDRDRGNESGLSEDDLLLKITTERNELEDRVRELESEDRKRADIKARRAQQAKALDIDPDRMEEARELFESGNIAGYQRILLKSLQEKADRTPFETAVQSLPVPPIETLDKYPSGWIDHPSTLPQPTLALSPDPQIVSAYPFPCLRCGQSIISPTDAFNHSNCGA